MWHILFALMAGIITVSIIYLGHIRRKDEESINELMRFTRESQQREMKRLAAKSVRPYRREGSNGVV